MEIVRGDLLTREGLAEALEGIENAFYLVDSVGGRSIFRNMEYAEKDKRAARNFMAAAEAAGLKRLIYLGALGEAVRIAFTEQTKGPGVRSVC